MVSKIGRQRKGGRKYLGDISNRTSKRNGIPLVVKLAPVQLEEFEEHLSKMVLWDEVAALHLGHELQHADD